MTGDMEERAARVGMTVEHYEAIIHCSSGLTDPAVTATAGSVDRICRWITAGSPEPDPSRIVWLGDDDRVREIVITTLATRLPRPVQWQAVEHVVWRGVGRRAAAWAAAAPPDLAPAGDQAHEICISTDMDYRVLPRLIAHELSHLWHRQVSLPVSAEFHREVAALSSRGRAALALTAAGDTGPVIRRRLDREALADATMRAWGFRPVDDDEASLQAEYEADLAEAAAFLPSESETE